MSMQNRAWSGKSEGTTWMHRCLLKIFRLMPPPFVYPIVYCWIIVSIIIQKSGRRGIYHYWKDIQKYNTFSSVKNLYLSYLEFGKSVLDRFAVWAGRKVELKIVHPEILDNLTCKPEGFIILNSHIGNQELAGYIIKMKKEAYVLTFTGDAKTINENRNSKFEEMGLHIIPVKEDGSHIFEMHNAICNGNILSIHGDRMFYGDRKLKASLLGKEASFPEGPFRVAVAEQVPVITLFMMRKNYREYTLYVCQLSDGTYKSSNHKEQAKELLDIYTKNIEHILDKYPKQWFHFYEFWKQ